MLPRTCRNIRTGKVWYPLYSTWVSGVGVPLLRGTCLCVRLPCATAVLPCAWACRTVCSGVLCYTLHGTWDSQVCVPLTSRHLLCMYVCRVLRLCRLVSGRVVLCVPLCCATHCIVHGIGGYVCHLLRGTCSVCTFAVCYGYATLCLDVSYCVHRYAVLPMA